MLLPPQILFVLQVLSQTHYSLITITPSLFALVISFKIGVSLWSCVRLLRPSDGLISNSIAGLMSVRTWEQTLLCAGNLQVLTLQTFPCAQKSHSHKRLQHAAARHSRAVGLSVCRGLFAQWQVCRSGSSLQLLLWSGTEESRLFWGKLGITVAALY